MARWTKAFPSYSTLYTYLDVDNWTVTADRVTFDIAGGVTSPYYWNVSGLNVEVGWWESGTYHAIGSGTVGYNRNGGDVEAYSGSDFFGRQAQDRTVYLYAEGTGGGTAYAESTAYTVPHLPGTPSGLTASRIGDNRIDLAWTNPTLSYEAMCVEVSIDGGSWSECAVIWNTATSYSYTAASADHIYRFRIRTFYRMAYSAYTAETPAISTSPAAPTAISTAAIQGSTNVAVELENASGSATGIEWQFSADGSTWGASTSVSGSPVTSFTASGVVGSGYIRVRNTNAVGSSAWLVSSKVTTICPPAAPTLRTPAASYVDMADGAVVFSWLHNSLDGSAQTAAQVEYEDLDYEEISDTRTISGNAQSYTLALESEFAVGDRIRWRVRTKGADASYGPWSDYRTFNLFTAPTVSITSPGATIDGMPVELRANYSDMSGYTCQAATASLTQNGQTLFSEAADIDGNAITASLDVSEFLPANGESYTVVLDVRSSSGLSASANATFAVDFDEPIEGTVQMSNDPDTGYVSLLASFSNDGAETPAVSISVARVNPDGSITPLITDGASGSGVVDMYAPLNTDYMYAATTKAASKAVSTVYVAHRIESPYWFAYWGDEVARARWNPSGGVSVTRPEKKRVHYVGREYPVSYDSLAIDQQNSLKFTGFPDEASDRFIELMRAGGRGVFKGCDGSVFNADFEYSTSANYTSVTRMDDVTLTVTRIDGGAL